MMQDKLLNKISDLEKEIALLPSGGIAKKRINNKDYYYHRITKNGIRTEEYISFENVDSLKKQILKRKELEKQLKQLMTSENSHNHNSSKLKFNTMIRTGSQMDDQISMVLKYQKRECITKLRNYVFGSFINKVFILYGLRRTGKTTLMRQVISELPESEYNKTAFIQVRSKDTLDDISHDLKILEENGYKYVFIDEVTLMNNFIEDAAIFSDIYSAAGMKIILSGTDSLSFIFAKADQLYDRSILLHTTFIPYREFERVLSVKGIDEYIKYGGTMSLSGINYNTDSTFASVKNTEEYINSAIARNIQHSLKMYQYGGHFRQLLDLYEKGELTNIINRVVENINHSFTTEVVKSTFKSHDISLTSSNMLKDVENPFNLKEHINLEKITSGIKKMLDILNIEEQSININEAHMIQIKEYLTMLDLINEIDVEYLPNVNNTGKLTVITQPGLRYAQAEAILKNLLLDEKFNELTIEEKNQVQERLLSEIRGRMMEEIILLETKLAKPDKKVFKLMFAVGEFDMVVCDSNSVTCEIYEIKYSKIRVKEQYRHITDDEKCAMVKHNYGTITNRYVIYRGDSSDEGPVKYLNVEEYLKSL